MTRLERLINLSAALLAASRPLTRAELRERVPGYPPDDSSFRRAFERDKEALRAMGIPISVQALHPGAPEAGEGYRILKEHYELPDPGLAPDELAALHLAASMVRMEGVEATAAIWKLGGAPTTAGDGPAGGIEQASRVALQGSEHLAHLFAAVGERRRVGFGYRGRHRRVDPWRLSFRNGRWYLSGLDHDRAEERQFRLDRIEGGVEAGEAAAFERPAAVDAAPPPPWAMGDEEPVTARLLVDGAQADWAVRQLGPPAVVERRPDGGVVLEARVTSRRGFRSFVLGFLDHAEVLGPPALRADMVAWLQGLAAGGAPG